MLDSFLNDFSFIRDTFEKTVTIISLEGLFLFFC
jgi:hypothetical protein